MPRTSYLRQIARRAEGNLPLLKPPRSIMGRGESRPFMQGSSALTAEPNTLLSIQAAAAVKEDKPSLSDTIEKTAEGEVTHEETARSANAPFKRHNPAVPKTRVPSSRRDAAEVEGSASPVVSGRPDTEIQITAAKARPRVSGEKRGALPAEQVVSAALVETPAMEVQITAAKPGSRVSVEKREASPAAQAEPTSQLQAIRSRQHSISEREQAEAASSVRSGPIDDPAPQSRDTSVKSPGESVQIRLVPLPALRPATPMREPKVLQSNAVHIGSIDVQIVPAPVAPPAPPTAHSTAQPQSAPALSREFTSSFGLRQG